MDSLTMLKQWHASTTKASRTTIASTILQEDDDGDGDDEGPFIDLEFSVPDDDSCKDSDDDAAAAAAALRALETTSLVFSSSESNSKPQSAVSLLKSATKFRVFMLGSKKPKTSASCPRHQLNNDNNDNKKMFVRFKVEEVPLMSLFTRDTSSKNNNNSESIAAAAASDDKKFTKEVLQKYLGKIKRLRFAGQVGSASSVSKPGSECDPPPSRLKTVNRRLGKSRSASATVAADRSPPRRRDDSLLQQQDGIQSAIAHCKRSFNAEKAPELPLVRSNSDPGNGRQETCKAETKVDSH
ncbi:putative membrane-associated kinase regulator [Dioscorea sansibarensis]